MLLHVSVRALTHLGASYILLHGRIYILLTSGMFDMQPEQARAQGPLQLLDALTSSDLPLPAGFLEDLLSRMDAPDLQNVVVPLSKSMLHCVCSAICCSPAILHQMHQVHQHL